MVAKISSNNSLFGTLLYNKNKLDKEEAKLLSSRNVYERVDGSFSMQTTIKSFEPYLIANKRTEKPIFHVSLNPNPKDILTDEQYKAIADRYMEDMGYSNQPYIVFKHTDISRTHLHIVSIRVDESGKKLDSNFENMRSMKICRQIEKDFNLHPATKQEQQAYSIPIKPLNNKEGNVKQQVGNIAKAVLNNYKFQSVEEFRTLLEKMNVSVEEVKGLKNEKSYHGLVYTALTHDSVTMKKEKVGTPFKSSLFGKSINLQTLEKHFEKSKQQIQDNKTREYLKSILFKAMQQSESMDEFKLLLKEKNIEPVFRQNVEGRIYGVSFIDYQNKAILNGSRLGKEFSANAFHEKFADENRVLTILTEQTEKKIESESDFITSLFPSLFEQHSTDYNVENFAREKQREEEVRKRKNRQRRL
ncbi:conjugal transfer protein MobB [Dysgonomonas sp. Marseille-P4361]|uniref:conjugal transfer protein MobB n=1 Tax=Dysgonomonas sp. Marseille-P4361 TaxID=2161820 RepID=UPI000D55E84B|nr:conjugal transfer protein MobB [Dysgonomonas sp. Marseille-P4361]